MDLESSFERVAPRESPSRGRAGSWFAATLPLAAVSALLCCDGASTVEDKPASRIDALRALPYVATVDLGEGDHATGVIAFDRESVGAGYNLYTSRTVPEAYLIDLEGRVVHRWREPPVATMKEGIHEHSGYWDAVELLEDGGLLAIRKFQHLVRLDRDSTLLWSVALHGHHDLEVVDTPVGKRILIIDREFQRYRGFRVRFPGITTLDMDGKILERWSGHREIGALAATLDTRDFLDTTLDDRSWSEVPRLAWMRLQSFWADHAQFDYFHLNTLKVIGESVISDDPRFSPGNLIICLRNVHQIAVLDRDTFEVVWSWGAGILDGPHQPHLLADGTILIFDNGRSRGVSRVLAVDPLTEQIVWEYPGPQGPPFFSRGMGSAQRLSNGNTLVCEALKGRVFEVTPTGGIVWEWLNPALIEDRREPVYRMRRFAPEKVTSWLSSRVPGARAEPDDVEASGS